MKEAGMLKNYEIARNLERIDVAKAIESFNGKQYIMILEGARRAREIAKTRDRIDRKNEKINYYGYKPINQALKDIIEDGPFDV
jgi:hypothetical protein